MKKIEEYLDGIYPDEIVPAIKGIIKSIKVDDEKGHQVIVITDGDTHISLKIKSKASWVIDPSEGHILSGTCASKKATAKGMTLKVNSRTQVPYILVTDGVVFTVTPPKQDAPPEYDEPMTDADRVIENYVLDRLYVYQRVAKIVSEFNGDKPEHERFPVIKLPEFATSVHMEVAKAGKVPRPTDKQLERKDFHKEAHNKKVESAEKKPTKSKEKEPEEGEKENWRDFKHPISGERIGDISVEKMATQFLPWVYRTRPDTLKPELAELHRVLRLAGKGLNITARRVLELYLANYIMEFAPNSQKRRDAALIKFCEGLAQKKISKEDIRDSVTETEAVEILSRFGSLWKEIVETK